MIQESGGEPAERPGWLAVAVVVLWLLAVVVGAYAALTWTLVRDARGCPRGIEAMDATSAQELERRDVPPKVVCRFDYEAQVDIYVHDTAPSLVAAAASVGAATAVTVGYNRRRRGRERAFRAA